MESKMIKVLFLSLIFSLPPILIGQIINDSLLSTFINQSLKDYSLFQNSHRDMEMFGEIIIRIDIDERGLIKGANSNIFKFISKEDNYRKYAHRNNSRNVYSVSHKKIAKDTIDIIIAESTVEYQGNELWTMVSCGGTLGYIPQGRFIYRKEKWDYISEKEIIDEKIKKRFEGN